MDSRTLLQGFMLICSVVLATEGEHVIKKAEESKTIAAREVNVEIDYDPVGCFGDKRKKKDRALENLVKSFRGRKMMWATWPDMSPVIQACAEEAFKKGFTAMFGVQHFGECWSSKTAESNYDKYGKRRKGCINGVGKGNANFVYRIRVNPVPAKAPNSVCNVDGQTFKDGDSMEVYKGDLGSGECEQCTCNDGMLMDCHHLFHCVLNDSSCNSYSKKPGQCCPTCERDVPDSAPVCRIKDRVYKEGESMEVLKGLGRMATSECHQCTCKAGKLQDCHRIYYCEVNKPGCNFIKAPGQCCPTCARVLPKPTPPSCKVNGRKYKDQESMEVLKMSDDKKIGACHQCMCKGGQVENCHHIFHCTLDNPNCASYKQMPGQCCPECVPVQSNEHAPSCKINGQPYKDGESAEVLKESAEQGYINCQQCKCQAGKHSCHKIFDCDIQNGACEKSLKIPGQCCPVCACYNNGQQLGSGDQWQKLSDNDCLQCTCNNDGTASCTRVQGSCQSA